MTKHYHFIGIGGIGMSGLARILLEKQMKVTGSDLNESATVTQLKKKGAVVKQGHGSSIPADATVVYSSAICEDNPEFAAAKAAKCSLMHRSELLAHLMEGNKTLAVAGTHGKTTVSSLLTAVLLEAKLDPSFALGGLLNGSNGKNGNGELFVIEADESDGSLVHYHPFGAIVTNIEAEHMDHYKSEDRLHKTFQRFFSQVKSSDHFFYCGEEMAVRPEKGISYGFSPDSDLRVFDYRQKGWNSLFSLEFEGKTFADIQMALMGSHNVLNAAAVFGLALRLGISESVIRQAFETFSGVARRCQRRGKWREVICVDDYAHHPTEVKKTLKAMRHASGERRLVVLFQPHRYSRTAENLEEYGKAFDLADQLFVTDIYAAGEKPLEGITPQKIIEKVQKSSTVPVSYLPRGQCAEVVEAFLSPHDLFVTLGAGDITHLHSELFQKSKPKKFTVGLIFGGQSAEHEISLKSARFVNSSLKRELYEVRHFGIDKEGKWITGGEAEECLAKGPTVCSQNASSMLSGSVAKELDKCDLLFPVLHGPYGEDGTIQGFMELLGKPYAGPDYRAAAICMDKVFTKKLAAAAGVPTLPFYNLAYRQWQDQPEKTVDEIGSQLRYPLFVKPLHVGSSVGISKVCTKEQLREAIDYAFRFDYRIMIEEGREGCRELEFAVMGNYGHPTLVPSPGEKLAHGAFVDYEKKYGKEAVQTTIDPQLDPEVLEQGKEFARKTYEATGNSGMTRVDFLLEPSGKWWFFEMNPIPGLQPLSLFPKIWKRENVPGEKLVDRLIILGLHRRREQNRHLQTL